MASRRFLLQIEIDVETQEFTRDACLEDVSYLHNFEEWTGSNDFARLVELQQRLYVAITSRPDWLTVFVECEAIDKYEEVLGFGDADGGLIDGDTRRDAVILQAVSCLPVADQKFWRKVFACGLVAENTEHLFHRFRAMHRRADLIDRDTLESVGLRFDSR